MTTEQAPSSTLYAGLSGLTLPVESFDLGHGVSLRKTYAHLTSPCMMAFSPPLKEGGYHPPPWRAARGGFAYDITVELRVPNQSLPGGFEPKETLWWILALLRIGYAPSIAAPVTIDMPFADAPTSALEPTITPFEVETPLFGVVEERSEIELGHLSWLQESWVRAANLASRHPKLLTAIKACDGCRVRARTSTSLLAAWGAIEQLFAPSTGELRFRVAANLATYLEPRGPKRLATYKLILSLYDHRSAAAHTVVESDRDAMLDSWILLRNALMKMISEDKVPTRDDFERAIFVGDGDTPGAISWGARRDATEDEPE